MCGGIFFKEHVCDGCSEFSIINAVRSCWSSRGSTCGGSITRYFLLHDSISRFDVCSSVVTVFVVVVVILKLIMLYARICYDYRH